MRWRLNKLNWSYGLGELLIVVAGVLIALAVDQWNTDRLNRLEEAELIDRLITDVNSDLESLDFQVASVRRKEASLVRVRSVLSVPDRRPGDAIQFLNDIIEGANFGWNQMSGRRTTYEQLLSSGTLSLISDPDLRFVIAGYYNDLEDQFVRMDERETQYPYISYRLVPRVDEGDDNSPGNVRLDRGVTEEEVEQIISRVLDSDLGDHIDAEINFARFVLSMSNSSLEQARNLVEKLEAYQKQL